MSAGHTGRASPLDIFEVFTPRRQCMHFERDVIWLHLVGDVLIGLAYMSIPFALLYFVRRRKDLAFDWMFLLFALFIILCGITHFFDVWALWQPLYRLDGYVKIATGLVSGATAVLLWRLVPRALAIPSADQLRAVNERLVAEIAERVRAQEELQRRGTDLERRVQERTAELEVVYANAPVGLCVLDRELRFVRINHYLAQANGLPPAAHIGKTIRELLPGLADHSEALFRAVLSSGESMRGVSLEGETPARPGESRAWLANFHPLRDDAGRVIGINIVCEEVTERRRVERALRESELYHRSLFDASPVGMAEINLESGRFLRVNPRYCALIGYAAEDLLAGTTILDVIPADDRDEARRVLAIFARGERDEAVTERRHVRRDGTVVWLHTALTLFREAAGQPARLLGVVQDITARKQAERSLQEFAAALRDADRRKDEFLAVLAHELRNPLAPVRTGLELLKLAPSAGQAARARDMMERQLGHMVRLIDDLLDVSRISRGKVTLKREAVALRAVVDSALEASRPLIAAARHELLVCLPEEPVQLFVDPTRLAQVLSNLLNNAAKYTPEGGKISLSAVREADSVALQVTDTGVGIPPEMLPRVFEMFTQVGRTVDRAQGGLGIGLSLVKRLVEMHGGSVTAESEGSGRGSTFTVRIPWTPAEPPAGDPAATAAGPPSDRRRVLVVDDNLDGAESLALMLELSGHEVRTAHDGPAALALAREFRPELVLLDIGLPGMNGYEVARRLRADPELARATLVALTGWGSDDDKRQAREAGFDVHLTKPVDAGTLATVLARLPPRAPS